MRAIGMRAARGAGDVSLPAAKGTSDERRERSVPLKQTARAADAPNKGAGCPLFAFRQSTCPAVEHGAA
jgi:hypothetical protein